jgi:hypothetical protein
MASTLIRVKGTGRSLPPPGRTISEHYQHNGRWLEPGTEFTVPGEGRFRFIAHVRTDRGAEWVDCWGGRMGQGQFRSFHIDRIKTVHWKAKTR